MKKELAGVGLALLSLTLSLCAFAEADGMAPAIVAAPGRAVCSSADVALGGSPAKGQLCVTEGSFGHDRYVFDLDGTAVITGIDDETTRGLSGSYKGQSLGMTCAPDIKKPADDDSYVVGLEKSMVEKRGMKPADAHNLAVAMATVEVGRTCIVKQAEAVLMKVPVRFP
ncbi:hypothetical protein [Dyella japonica]|uniref:Uncharacterized protein n=1 Tax=Dyella japonica A8 TaxID=1217721 RepID=A0A075K4Q6_9GAMM|nr:hypothetical protein [Dyella japonica]AIF47158.1 hypothetical protein HY57_07650 [Dyella japonica A8]